MPRGGHRENAGRKNAWKNVETQVIRVPKVLVPQLMQIARKLDSGELLEFVTKSDTGSGVNEVELSSAWSNLLEFSHSIETDSETKSETLNLPAPLSARALSRRLGVDKSGGSLVKKRDKPDFDFLEWTRKIDPEGFGWIYNEQDRQYHPAIDSVTNSNDVV
jgi:hypothetical protein